MPDEDQELEHQPDPHSLMVPMVQAPLSDDYQTGMLQLEESIGMKIQNIVATVNLCCILDLKKISLELRNCEYNPKRFAAVIMRIVSPRTTALIFSTGKMVVTGAKSESDSLLAARKYGRIIQKLGYKVHFKNFTIQNMVSSCDIKFPIKLEAIVKEHFQYCSFEPELFPGLIYRLGQPRAVVLMFVSGKIVITGVKSRLAIRQAFSSIYVIARKYQKQDHSVTAQ